jgi:PadR family transcriptional regulator PadR
MSGRRALDEAKKGSAEVVILSIVEHDGHHGYEIAKLIEQRTDGSLRFTLASLYSTLYRMEDRGWIKGRWVEKAGQRRRCYYRITEPGRRILADQRADWARFMVALTQVAGVKPATLINGAGVKTAPA